MTSHNSFNRAQPATKADKAEVAKGALGLSEGGKPSGPGKFQRLEVSLAQNGYEVSHTPPEAEVNAKQDGPTYQSPKKFVFGHDHAIAKHIKAISDHCTGDCDLDADDGADGPN